MSVHLFDLEVIWATTGTFKYKQTCSLQERLLPIWQKRTCLPTKIKVMDMEDRPVVAKGKGEGVGWTWSLGLVDANYCI